MSGIAVVFHRDGAPVAREQLVRMTDRIAHRGPDGIGHWVTGPVGLAHCALHTLPEDVGQTQPIHSAASQFHLTFDGRIDNRDDLLKTLALPPGIPDAEIVLAAYAKWGESCPERLLGDFAFALWDERLQQLFCARDILGVRPFYYFVNRSVFLAASERSALFTHPSVTYTPNELVIAALLHLPQISQSETIHRDVLRLPAASCMTVTNSELRIRRYWDIEAIRPGRQRPSAEYVEGLWSILREATHCRMRSNREVGILLSGGLDSTAIAASAAEIRDAGHFGEKSLEAYSQVFPGWEEADESSLIDATTKALSMPSHRFNNPFRSAGGYETGIEQSVEMIDYANDAFWDELRTAAAANGVRVLLSGMGGDEWLTGSPYQSADLIRQGRLLAALDLARTTAATKELPLRNVVWNYGIRPVIPAPVVGAVRWIRTPPIEIPEWIGPDLIRRTQFQSRLLMSFTSVERRKVAAHHTFVSGYNRGEQTHFFESHGRLNSRFGIETRHPFHDRRVIEFSLAMPDCEKLQGSVKKRVLRSAMAGKVPATVLERQGKSNFARVVMLELRRHCARGFFSNLEISHRGWVDDQEIRKVWERLLAAAPDGQYLRHRAPQSLWRAFGLELLVRRGLL